jgi:predicted nucleotidyltransferase
LKELSIGKEYLSIIKETVVTSLKDDKVKIVLFGSRARGDNNRCSDVDIGIIPFGKFKEERITLLKEKVENLNIPYKVEIVNLSEVSEEFKTEAMKDAVIWKD